MKTNVVSIFPTLDIKHPHVRSNAFTHHKNRHHQVLNAKDDVLCVKSLSIIKGGKFNFQLKALIAMPSDDIWLAVVDDYKTVEEAKIVALDFFSEAKKAKNTPPLQILDAELDLMSERTEIYGYSVIFKTIFKFARA